MSPSTSRCPVGSPDKLSPSMRKLLAEFRTHGSAPIYAFARRRTALALERRGLMERTTGGRWQATDDGRRANGLPAAEPTGRTIEELRHADR